MERKYEFGRGVVVEGLRSGKLNDGGVTRVFSVVDLLTRVFSRSCREPHNIGL